MDLNWEDQERYDREFFWGIVATLNYQFVVDLIEDARVQRAQSRKENMPAPKEVVASDRWLVKLD